jgi:hypothetical protein
MPFDGTIKPVGPVATASDATVKVIQKGIVARAQARDDLHAELRAVGYGPSVNGPVAAFAARPGLAASPLIVSAKGRRAT